MENPGSNAYKRTVHKPAFSHESGAGRDFSNNKYQAKLNP